MTKTKLEKNTYLAHLRVLHHALVGSASPGGSSTDCKYILGLTILRLLYCLRLKRLACERSAAYMPAHGIDILACLFTC